MSWQQFKHAWLIKFWAPIPAVIAAGILSTYYFGITGTFWAVTGEFTRWGGQLLQLFGVHAEEWGYFKIIRRQRQMCIRDSALPCCPSSVFP